jgi:hypothetical protein
VRQIRQEVRGNVVRTTSEIETPRRTLRAITERNPTTNTVWTTRYPVNSRQDAEALRSLPWDLPAGLEAPGPDALVGELGRRGVLSTRISSPFVCVAGMMPYQMFLEWCATDLPLLCDLSALCQQRIMAILDVLLADGRIEYVWMGGCEWLTPPMGSPQLYEELVQPYERALIERIHAAGAVCHVHCHGRVRSTLERVIARGGDFFEPVEPPPDGDLTFAEAKALTAGRMTLGGNVEARVVANDSHDAVESAARRAFDGGKQRMVFKLSEGPLCALSPRVARNYHRIVDVWEEVSAI